jgi:RNA polymerase subunit RPABC4/transcription elongation factor Spt4
MEPEAGFETEEGIMFCPKCGAEESGYFCRSCGTLLRGEDMVLCPRCHEVVPEGDYCNRCGQTLAGIALHLRQLALAGDDFWITSEAEPAEPAAAESDLDFFFEDESLEIEEAELPDWLHELPVETAPAQVRERVYPALRPMQERQTGGMQRNFLMYLILLMGLMLVGLVAVTILVLIQGA